MLGAMGRMAPWVAAAVSAWVIAGCGGSGQQAARVRHAKEFDCSHDEVKVAPEGKLWSAQGCGHTATYECTRDAMETRCVMLKRDGKDR